MKKLMLTLITITIATTTWGASSPMFRATAQRTGVAREQARPTLTPLWEFQTQANIVSSPVVYKDSVYFGTRANQIWSLNALTGAQQWNFSTGDWVDATPCVSSDTVYCSCRDQNLYAINRLTGELRWHVNTNSTDVSSPLLVGTKLYFVSGSPATALYEIDTSRQDHPINAHSLSSFGFSSPSISDGILYFGTNDGILHAFDTSLGKMKWDPEPSTKSNFGFGCIAVTTSAVYAIAGGDERRLFAFDLQSGATVWQQSLNENETAAVSSIAADDNAIYAICTKTTHISDMVSDCKLILYAFSLDGTTKPNWNPAGVEIGHANPIGIVASPTVADGVIYAASGDGNLYCIDASNGQYIDPASGASGSTPVGAYLSYSGVDVSTGIVASPTVSNGVVYVNTLDGRVWALQAQNAASMSSPDNSDTVVNQANIIGTATNTAFSSYKLEYGMGANPVPSDWETIISTTTPVSNGILSSWKTNIPGLSDGIYTLRLTVNNDPMSSALNTITVDNSPAAPSGIKAVDTPYDGGGSLTIAWNKSADDGAGNKDVQSYQLYKSTWPGGFAPIAKNYAGTKDYTTFIDSACPMYTAYYYVVTAMDHNSESGYSGVPAAAFSIADGISVGPAGGPIPVLLNGLTNYVMVEPLTFSTTVYMGIEISAEASDQGIGKARATTIERKFIINPANTPFLSPVPNPITIEIPYTPQDVTGIAKEDLRIYWLDTAANDWRTINTSDPSSKEGYVIAKIPNFTQSGSLTCRIMGYVQGSEELLNESKVYTYPNPAKGDKLSFKYYLGSKADVKVDVYNVAGQLIAHFEKDNNPAGIASEFEWNMQNIASGVYIWRIEARSGSETKAIKKKLAVIH